MANESVFQRKLIQDLKIIFPGCVVLKNDANYKQGIPDLSIFYGPRWAWLECKKNGTASHRPNQDHYISIGDMMGFAAFIYPENREEVIEKLKLYFNGGQLDGI